VLTSSFLGAAITHLPIHQVGTLPAYRPLRFSYITTMSSDLRNLLIEQNAAIDSLKRVLVNFRKLAKANVTLPRAQSRLHSLEQIWTTCRDLHVKFLQLTSMEEQRSIPYFSKEKFLAAEDSYHETADALQEVISRFTSSQFSIENRSADSSLRESNNNGFQLPRIALSKFSGKLIE